MTESSIDLSNQFLIAMPNTADPEFAGAVVYVCEHTSSGALGLVINRPTDLTVGSLLERIELPTEDATTAGMPVFYGGPVQTDRGFVLHAPAGDYTSSIQIGELSLTTSRDVLQAVAQGRGPERLFVSLGYSGWGAGQLESELSRNTWLNVDADADVIFEVPPAQRFDAALKLLGIDPVMLAGDAGHA